MSEAERIKRTLVDTYGCRFMPEYRVHFFEGTFRDDREEQNTVWFLDSLYAALCAEPIYAFRAYVQACEYSAAPAHRPLRYQWEGAMYEARNRIESFVRG